MSLFLTGQRLTADLLNAQIEPASCHVVQQSGAAQTGWTASTSTAITFGTGSTVIDTDGIHSESSNTSRLVIGKKLGWWKVSGVYCPAANNAGAQVRAIIYKNGSAVPGSFAEPPPNSTTNFMGITTPVVYVQATVATDYVELMGFMAAGSGTLGTSTSSPYVNCSLTATWVRPS